MNIFFDLDGTLIDSRERLYRLFQHLVKEASEWSFDTYWNYKRNKIGHREILMSQFHFQQKQVEDFQVKWMQYIEHSEWLQYDRPFQALSAHLNDLNKEHQLYVVTARQSEAMVHHQLSQFGWKDLFTNVFVTQQKWEKAALILNSGISINQKDWFIGDTGKDIQTGKALGMKTAAVLSGFLNREKLLEYNPDIIINSVVEFNIIEVS